MWYILSAQLVTHGPTRQDALDSMAKALDYYTIRGSYIVTTLSLPCMEDILCATGVNHNIPLLRDIITQPQFVQGDITTKFIEEVYPNGFKGKQINIVLDIAHILIIQ